MIKIPIIRNKVDYIRIDGNVNTELRHQSVRHFQEDPNCLVAILSITASSLGITMTAATNVIFAEVHWTPAHLLQAEDRVHRIGQENSVNIYYLFGKDTMDEIIFPVLRQKSHVISETLDARRTDYNLNIKAKQGLNSEEKENLEREALVRKRDYEKMQKENSKELSAYSGRIGKAKYPIIRTNLPKIPNEEPESASEEVSDYSSYIAPEDKSLKNETKQQMEESNLAVEEQPKETS